MASNKKHPDNVRKYRKPLNLNIGLIIFGIIFIYIIICVFLYFTANHIVGYEVNMGTLSMDNVYTGIAIRQEQVVNSDYSGYINYYVREGEKLGVSNLVYSVDESGKLSETINPSAVNGENSLTDENLSELKTDILSFINTYENKDFSKIYDFKYNIQGAVLKLSNVNTLSTLGSLSGNQLSGIVNFGRCVKDGVITYNIDGYEDLKPADVTSDLFQKEKYERKQLINNELVGKGDPVYKLATSENWSIIIPIGADRAAEFAEDPYIEVKFLKNQEKSWATVTVLNNADGTYAQLDFNNSMVTFCSDRYIDLELETNEEQGLKIPLSAIVEREFFLVPSDYIMKRGEAGSAEDGVLLESYDEEGKVSKQFVATTLYNLKDDEYYLDDTVLEIGDYIVKQDSSDKYAISKKASLIGVYNINKGYADFRQIHILYQNEEYAIVESNTQYGLNVYDYIVLDASTVKENDFVK